MDKACIADITMCVRAVHLVEKSRNSSITLLTSYIVSVQHPLLRARNCVGMSMLAHTHVPSGTAASASPLRNKQQQQQHTGQSAPQQPADMQRQQQQQVEQQQDEQGMRQPIPQIIHQNYLAGPQQLLADAMQPLSHFRKEWWLSCKVCK